MQAAAENAAKNAKSAPPRRLTPGEGFFVGEQLAPRKDGHGTLSGRLSPGLCHVFSSFWRPVARAGAMPQTFGATYLTEHQTGVT